MLLSNRIVTCLLLVATCLATTTLSAQPLGSSTYEDLIAVAEDQLLYNRPYNALKLFKEAYDEQPSAELAYRIAEMNYELRDYKQAANYFTRAMRKAADGEMAEGLFYLGRSQKMQGLYGEAMEAFKEFQLMAPGHEFQERADVEIAGCRMAIEMNDPPRIKVDNAGREVNTSNQEYSPVLASDGNLYYAGFGKNGYVMEEGEKAASIRLYVAKGGEDGSYSRGVALPKSINRSGYQTANVSVSPDANTMLFIRTKLDGTTVVESKIFYADKGSGGQWGNVEEVKGVNGEYIAKNPAFGELFGEQVMFLSSNMKGGQGGYDLYYATKRGEGQYDRPVNLGPSVNSAYDDVTPFYVDGTLYFSTEGRPSLGGFDIFRTEWSGETWSDPVNMGKGFNSSYDDRYFQLDKTGKNGVITSNRPPTRSVKSKTCCDDVFLLNVEPIIIELLAMTLDGDGQLLPEVTVDLAELADGDTTIIARKLNPKGNRFDFSLVDGKTYLLLGRRDGYEDASAELNTLGITEPSTLEKTLVLTASKVIEPTRNPDEETIEITLNQPIRLANIYYDFDDDKILPEAEPDLQYILNLLEEYPEMVIELGSHTDARGQDSYNQKLSQRRAQSAVNWIAARNIATERLVAKGYGETVILNQCENGVRCDDEEHRFNRRTEFKILQGPQTIQVKKLTRTRELPDRGVQPATGMIMSRDTMPSSGASSEALQIAETFDITPTSVQETPITKVSDDLSSLYYEKDISTAPVLTFQERRIEFGLIEKGEKREHRYIFKNLGTVPASIAIATACECTTLDWTQGEIAPGELGYINAIFDSSEKEAGELIVIDIILDQEMPNGNGIIERVQYTFEMEE